MDGVLLVGYKRPENLIKLATLCMANDLKLYIFVDSSVNYNELNEDCKKFALELERDGIASCKISSGNCGVAIAVPTALNWAFNTAEILLILEDDCMPNQFAIEYFREMSQKLSSNIIMISGSNPLENLELNESHISSFPLIWGWVTNKKSWELLQAEVRSSTFMLLVKSLKNQPSYYLEIMFFLAARIRIKKGTLRAWDANLVLPMLANRWKTTFPDQSVISNIGNDGVAHHEFNVKSIHISKASQKQPSIGINFDNCRNIDREITRKFYGMKLRHIFSPIKALLINS
jgi:hypothetical protein